MYGVTSEQVTMSTLHFQVVAFDRYSRDTVVGECVYRLADAELMLYQEMRPAEAYFYCNLGKLLIKFREVISEKRYAW
ncbi:unnamed protein product [Strongylus vulgaris]|uniref:Uncharacterized protein n=1 Tax=Strongylus vulgaris TaxID=40348 RepID=A0A3P7JY59_STRVU|nr:unnamed protein product [Strongylus vulgaris]